jgi:hypothetical protein
MMLVVHGDEVAAGQHLGREHGGHAQAHVVQEHPGPARLGVDVDPARFGAGEEEGVGGVLDLPHQALHQAEGPILQGPSGEIPEGKVEEVLVAPDGHAADDNPGHHQLYRHPTQAGGVLRAGLGIAEHAQAAAELISAHHLEAVPGDAPSPPRSGCRPPTGQRLWCSNDDGGAPGLAQGRRGERQQQRQARHHLHQGGAAGERDEAARLTGARGVRCGERPRDPGPPRLARQAVAPPARATTATTAATSALCEWRMDL